MDRVTVELMGKAPIGRYVTGDNYAHFCASPELWGVIFWGRPGAETAKQIGRTLVLELSPPAIPHAKLVDASRLEGADSAAFDYLEGYMRAYGDRLAKFVTKVALVRPPGLSGAIVSGVFDVVARPYPVEVFATAADAVAWTGGPEGLVSMLDPLFAEASNTPVLISALEQALDNDLVHVTVGSAAKQLSMSERTLQRKLAEHGTTFQAELGATRIRVAKRMLVESDAPLTRIALDVGCASLQHFSALFRRLAGEPPSAWRKRHRR